MPDIVKFYRCLRGAGWNKREALLWTLRVYLIRWRAKSIYKRQPT
jgi:hypothetical protein